MNDLLDPHRKCCENSLIKFKCDANEYYSFRYLDVRQKGWRNMGLIVIF